jgi:hypothetical protein
MMTLHRDPPRPTSTEPVAVPAGEIIDGRACWPSVVMYHWYGQGETAGYVAKPYPPIEREPLAVTLARPEASLGMSAMQPRTQPYRVVVQPGKQAEYEALVRSGRLSDPRHTGADA